MQETAPMNPESPGHVRISLAAAMTLGITDGSFYRDARLRCINLLMTYDEGCKANCAYCGLQKSREGTYDRKSFIRVPWPIVSLAEIVRRSRQRPHEVRRICLSMITHKNAVADSFEILDYLHKTLPEVPLSLLCTPTLLQPHALRSYRRIPVDRLGIAVDAATEPLFDRCRGRGVRGPHRWRHYWRLFHEAVQIFGADRVGIHLIVGLGETEQEIIHRIAEVRRAGGSTHLFCFFPEGGSRLQTRPQPPAGQYRRVQLARYLLDNDLVRFEGLSFSPRGQILDFGLPAAELDGIVGSGWPFMTSGCPDKTGEVVCTRPFGDCKPGDDIRSYPFQPEPEDIALIREQLADYGMRAD